MRVSRALSSSNFEDSCLSVYMHQESLDLKLPKASETFKNAGRLWHRPPKTLGCDEIVRQIASYI